MTFGERIVGALKLDARTFEDIESDPTALGQAIGVIALAALASSLGNIWSGGIFAMVFGIIAALLGYVLWAVVVWAVGTKLMPEPQTRADLPETFRTIGFAAAPGLLGVVSIIPFLGWLLMILLMPIIWLWTMAAMVVAVKAVLDYTDTFKAVVVVIIGFVAYLVVWGTFVAMSFGAALLTGGLGR